MKNIISDLSNKATELLESQWSDEARQLKAQIQSTYESLKPTNIIKSNFEEPRNSADSKDTIVNAALGVALGYVSNVLINSISRHPLSKLASTILIFGITNAVVKNPELVKSAAGKFFRFLGSKSQDKFIDMDYEVVT